MIVNMCSLLIILQLSIQYLVSLILKKSFDFVSKQLKRIKSDC